MSDFVISAVLELKDKMSANLKKSKSSLSGMASGFRELVSSSEGAVSAMAKTGSAAEQMAGKADKVKKSLLGINGVYQATLDTKDQASGKIRAVKNELGALAGKTYTAVVNVKNNIAGKTKSMLTSGIGQMAGAAGIGYGVYDTVKTYMDFEAQLSEVKALTNLDLATMDKVKQKAMELSIGTAFDGTEVAKGMTELLKAGVDVKSVLGEATEAALNLATAGSLALPEAAEIMSGAMNAFKVKDPTYAADILAGAANASATSVGEMKYALAACGAVAAGAGMDFKDTNTALAVFAQNNLRGSDAGTSLKTMLANLIPKTKNAVETFKKFNLLTKQGTSAFFDETGKMKSLAEIAGLLQDRMKGLTKEQQIGAMYDMFGSDAIRGGMILAQGGADSVIKMFNEMSKVTSKDMAIAMYDNLRGDFDQLSDSWRNFQITLLDGRASKGLRGFFQELTDLVQFATDRIKDGLDFSDICAVAGKALEDLWGKAMKFDGVGSALANGALVVGLIKIASWAHKSVKWLQKLKETKLPGGINGKLGDLTADMIVNAQTVIVNGKISSGGKDLPDLPGGKGRSKGKGRFSKAGGRWGKLGGKVLTGLGLALGAYEIYDTVRENKKRSNEAAGRNKAYQDKVKKENKARLSGSVGGFAGGLAGAKAGAMAGGFFGPLGAFIGGAAGGIGGYALGSGLGKNIDGFLEQLKSSNASGNINGSVLLPQPVKSSVSDPRFGSDILLNVQKKSYNNAFGGNNDEQKIGAFKEKIKANWQDLSSWFSTTVWQPVKSAGKSAASAVTDGFSSAWQSIKSIWSGAASWFDSTVWQPIKSGLNWAKERYNELKSMGKAGIDFASKKLGIGHNATGASYFKGGFTEINERGGEIVDLPGGSRIYPAATTQRILEKEFSRSSSAPTVTISGNTFTIREEADIPKIAHELVQQFLQAQINYSGA